MYQDLSAYWMEHKIYIFSGLVRKLFELILLLKSSVSYRQRLNRIGYTILISLVYYIHLFFSMPVAAYHIEDIVR